MYYHRPATNACLFCSHYQLAFFRLHYRHFGVFNILFLLRVREAREQLFCFLLTLVAVNGVFCDLVAEMAVGSPSQCGIGWLWFYHDWNTSRGTKMKA